MRLVYEKSGLEVQVGYKVVGPHGEVFTVEYFREPHSPASSGKITVKDFQDHTHEKSLPLVAMDGGYYHG